MLKMPPVAKGKRAEITGENAGCHTGTGRMPSRVAERVPPATPATTRYTHRAEPRPHEPAGDLATRVTAGRRGGRVAAAAPEPSPTETVESRTSGGSPRADAPEPPAGRHAPAAGVNALRCTNPAPRRTRSARMGYSTEREGQWRRRRTRDNLLERMGPGPRKRFATLPAPPLVSVTALALGRGLHPLRRRARRVSIDRTVRSFRGHLFAQDSEVVLCRTDPRHRLTAQEIVAGVALADGELQARHPRPECSITAEPF